MPKLDASLLAALRARRDRASFWSLGSFPGLSVELRPALEATLERRYLEWWDHHLEPLLGDLERGQLERGKKGRS